MTWNKSHRILFLNTIAFTICFAAWTSNGVLVTFLVDNGVFDWTTVQMGWLFGIPILTGSIFRIPLGILTDKFGGRMVYGLLLLLSAVPMYFLSYANSFLSFALLSAGFGMAGTSFAVGIAYSSIWYKKEHQGTALGIFGAGNAGAALTTLVGPRLLNNLTNHATNLEAWRELPKIYAASLFITGIVFFLFTETKLPEGQANKTLSELLQPLRRMRVWRFSLYYFLVFGCFVAFSQWLLPYFVNVYTVSLVTAGYWSSWFSFPSGVIRALGGWCSDKYGAQKVMYWVLGSSLIISLMLTVPRLESYSPGAGIMAKKAGVVASVTDSEIVVSNVTYQLAAKESVNYDENADILIWPTKQSWHKPMVKVGDTVVKKQLLAQGITRIYFQANVWIFGILVITIGIIWGIGKAAVFKHIADYFPKEVGVVGGLVGALGGLGGFFCPIIFGYLLKFTGLWTSCWMFMFILSAACLIWMHSVVQSMLRSKDPNLLRELEKK
ncbi:MAG: MFS transporter [Deltaproteobacteria bacterium]|nr:MFS transporter [Deltaproteobacteria bacterium]